MNNFFIKLLLSTFGLNGLILILLHQTLGTKRGDAAYAQIAPILAAVQSQGSGQTGG